MNKKAAIDSIENEILNEENEMQAYSVWVTRISDMKGCYINAYAKRKLFASKLALVRISSKCAPCEGATSNAHISIINGPYIIILWSRSLYGPHLVLLHNRRWV